MNRGPFQNVIVQAVVLVVIGLVVGAVNNATAGAKRRLEWVKDYPDLPKPGATPAETPDAAQPDGGAAAVPVTPTTPTTAPAGAADLTGVEVPPADPAQPYQDITGLQALKAHEEGALFIDARRSDVYAEGHVAGALSLSVWEAGVDEKVEQLLFELEGDTTRPIVVYCSGGDCVDSHALADKLWQAGYTRVLVYKDGYPDWVARGGQTKTGSER